MTSPPAWLESLVELIIDNVIAHNTIGSFGYRYGQEDQLWEVILYPTPIELRGGAQDGAVIAPGFSLDLKSLYEAFDDIEALYWNAHSFSPSDQDDPSVSIEGHYQGHYVYLQILAYAPDDEPPSMALDLPPAAPNSLH